MSRKMDLNLIQIHKYLFFLRTETGKNRNLRFCYMKFFCDPADQFLIRLAVYRRGIKTHDPFEF